MKKNIFFCVFLIFSQIFLTKAQVKVLFKTHVAAGIKTPADYLYVAGSFNNWNAADSGWKMHKCNEGDFTLNQTLSPGVYNYKITRGNWQKVECTTDGKSIENRVLKLNKDTTIDITVLQWQDNFAPEERKHTATAQVHILAEKFDMPQLGRQRRIWIYLPKGYEKSKRHYPVLYMHDGQNLFDAYTSGFGEWGVDEFMGQVPDAKQCIIIGIDHGGDHRLTEYNPYNSKYGKGEGNAYADFLVKTLKPYVDAHYRTNKDAKYTAIAGSSMGGIISMYAALKYPGVFGNVGVFSPAFWISPDMFTYAEGRKTSSTSFYFACGDAESDTMVSDMQKMVAIVRRYGLSKPNSPVTIVTGAIHNEKQWHDEFPAFYQWLSSRWLLGK